MTHGTNHGPRLSGTEFAASPDGSKHHACISRESNPGYIDGNDVFCH